MTSLPPEAFAAALASMPSVGPARLRSLLAADPPARAWERATEESGGSIGAVEHVWQRLTKLGLRTVLAVEP